MIYDILIVNLRDSKTKDAKTKTFLFGLLSYYVYTCPAVCTSLYSYLVIYMVIYLVIYLVIYINSRCVTYELKNT